MPELDLVLESIQKAETIRTDTVKIAGKTLVRQDYLKRLENN
jgi:hypothetical protein